MKYTIRTFLTVTGLALAATLTVMAAVAPSTSADSQTITGASVSPSEPFSLHVHHIELKAQDGSGRVTGKVHIQGDAPDKKGNLKPNKNIPEARVFVNWAPGGGQSMLTDSKGIASFEIAGPPGNYTLTVTNVTKDDYIYDMSANKETSEEKTLK